MFLFHICTIFLSMFIDKQTQTHTHIPSGVLGEGPELGSCTQTQLESNPWLRIELAPEFRTNNIRRIRIFNREDCCHERLHDFEVRVGNNSDIAKNPICFRWRGGKCACRLDGCTPARCKFMFKPKHDDFFC